MFEKLAGSVLVSAWLIWGVNAIGDLVVSTGPLEAAVFPAAAPETARAAAPETTKTAAPEAAAGALAMLASADIAAGEKTFKKCKACHSTKKGGKNKIGPNLWNIVGQGKASAPGYKYSSALSGLGGEWGYQELDGFLANPRGFAKGTKMSFSGLRKAKARAAVIVYLRSLSDQPKPLP
jgi:cytochrome c